MNPAVLFHAVASGHNDVLVALAIAVGFLLLVRDRSLAAVAILALGALIKASVALPLVLVIVWCVARSPRGQRGRTAATHRAWPIAVGLVFAVPYLQPRIPPSACSSPRRTRGGSRRRSWYGRCSSGSASAPSAGSPGVVFAIVLVVTFIRLGPRRARRAVDREPIEAVGAAMGWSLVALMLLGPVLPFWYVAWALPVAWLLPRPPRATVIAAGAALALAQWSTEPLRYPDAFAVNLWMGHWIVTPAMLVLVIWCLVDLRRRIRTAVPARSGAHTRRGRRAPQARAGPHHPSRGTPRRSRASATIVAPRRPTPGPTPPPRPDRRTSTGPIRLRRTKERARRHWRGAIREGGTAPARVARRQRRGSGIDERTSAPSAGSAPTAAACQVHEPVVDELGRVDVPLGGDEDRSLPRGRSASVIRDSASYSSSPRSVGRPASRSSSAHEDVQSSARSAMTAARAMFATFVALNVTKRSGSSTTMTTACRSERLGDPPTRSPPRGPRRVMYGC